MFLIFRLIFVSYLSLALALVIGNGHYQPIAFGFSVLGLLSLLTAVWLYWKKKDQVLSSLPSSTSWVLGGIFVSLICMAAGRGVIYPIDGAAVRPTLFIFSLIVCFLTLGLIHFKDQKKTFLFLFSLILTTWIVLSIWVVRVSPEPKIDVWYFQQGAARALWNGENPYEKFFDVPLKSLIYFIVDFYVYPPYTLLITAPFYKFFGDVRYGFLFCQAVSALFLFGICKKLKKSLFESVLFCVLFLFHPVWPFVLEQAWTESSFVVLLFASVFFFVNSQPKSGASLAGFFFGAKPYLPPLALLYLRFVSRKDFFQTALRVVLFSAVLPLIFFLQSPISFYQNVVQFHFNSPFRADSLSFPAFLARHFQASWPSSLSFFLLLGVLLAGMKFRKLEAFGLFASLAYFLFFWFNKQAFCNYYFFVGALLILSLALIPFQPGEGFYQKKT